MQVDSIFFVYKSIHKTWKKKIKKNNTHTFKEWDSTATLPQKATCAICVLLILYCVRDSDRKNSNLFEHPCPEITVLKRTRKYISTK